MPLDRARLLDSIQTGQPRNITVSLLKFSSKWGLWSCPQQPMSVSTGYSGKSFIHALAWWRRPVCVCGTSERMFQTSASGGRRMWGGLRPTRRPPIPMIQLCAVHKPYALVVLLDSTATHFHIVYLLRFSKLPSTTLHGSWEPNSSAKPEPRAVQLECDFRSSQHATPQINHYSIISQ